MTTKMMQAIQVYQYGGSEQLKLAQIPCPAPESGEVLVRVHAAGVLPVDWKIRQGALRVFQPETFPYIPGSAFAGVVEQVGLDVTALQPGQAVFGRSASGAYAEYATAAVGALARKPESLSFDAAAAISGGATTAWEVLFEQGDLKPGQSVLVLGGAGGVGSFAVQLAHWKGARVIGTTSTPNKEFVRQLGADLVIDYLTTPVEEVVPTVDLILDTVGGLAFERGWPLMKRGSTFISLAAQPDQKQAQELGVRALRFSGSRAATGLLGTIARLIDDGDIHVTLNKIFPLKEARLAHELSQNRHGRGRIVLHIAD